MTSEHTDAPIEVVPSVPTDLDAIAAVHVAAFGSSFMSKLGRDLVARMYAWHLDTGTETAIHVARVDGRIVGFVLHGLSFRSIDRFVLRNATRIGARIARHPARFVGADDTGRWRQGLSLLRSRVARRPDRSTRPPDRSIGILSIGVDPTVEGRGVGTAMMETVERIARERGVDALRLSVRTENERGRRFYAKLGWREVGERPTGGIDMRLDLHQRSG